ncbi:MAG: hypothetical protein JWO98_4021 [Frankiales bacterium]|nr:hypothetical protein [Frankiales bacterium]
MTAQADPTERANPDLEVRQWLFENLAHVESQVVRYPPQPVVDALAGLGLPAAFDIGWSQVDHDRRSGKTTWTCTLATAGHLVDLSAEAQRQDDHLWSGNEAGRETVYQREPIVSVKVSRLDDVRGLTLKIEGSRESSSYAAPRLTWGFTFSDGEPREYVVGDRDDAAAHGVEALCRRLAANI